MTYALPWRYSTTELKGQVDPKEIPLPHEFILNRDLLAQLYPSFAEGATPFFTLNWSTRSSSSYSHHGKMECFLHRGGRGARELPT
ncbi:hypothetical protein L484_010617 [Morus notabilis]|uniref:Uncharacterized protein n=1 Tax=Morus notabilis TaxID=981085 RepID=W9QNL6_9ROSA|nr:hypothetical protein L484_010617 [Morus notabilis]